LIEDAGFRKSAFFIYKLVYKIDVMKVTEVYFVTLFLNQTYAPA